MSNRHRSHKETAPGATHPAPPKEERKAANRKARHRTHELLASMRDPSEQVAVAPPGPAPVSVLGPASAREHEPAP